MRPRFGAGLLAAGPRPGAGVVGNQLVFLLGEDTNNFAQTVSLMDIERIVKMYINNFFNSY